MSKNPSREAVTRQASAVLQFPQPALQLIYDTAPIGLAFLSPDCRYLQINQRLTEICGISVEGHLGHTVRDCVPALADSVEEIVRSIMATGEPVTGIEVAGQRADQIEERFWITYWHPLFGPGGNIVGINVAAEEITERKRAEAALQRSEHEVRRAKEAAEATLRDLRETQDSLIEAEKLAALGRLVAGIAHEVNSPVGASLTVASSLERKSVQFAAEAARGDIRRSSLNRFLQATRDASAQLVANLQRAADLIDSFKQVAVDRSYLELCGFDPADLITQVVENVCPGQRKPNLKLDVVCPPGLTMHSYPGPLGQALTNLLLNAVTHAFPDDREGRIDIRIQASGDQHVELSFRDDGCGMSPDTKRQAFDPFFTTHRDQGGVGLGLHIVYNIVTNRLGGRIHLDSEPGEGTRIQLILPREAPAEPGGAASLDEGSI